LSRKISGAIKIIEAEKSSTENKKRKDDEEGEEVRIKK